MADKLQEQVAAIWARALGVKKVGPDDNFFALGGHSLLGVKLIAEIQAKTVASITDRSVGITQLMRQKGRIPIDFG